MNIRISLLLLNCYLGIAAIVPADEPKTEKASAAAADELTTEAQATAAELRSSLSPDSEAIAMLNDILKGSNLGSKDGWFPLAKPQSRFDWDYVWNHYEANSDGAIQRNEFKGSDSDFERLDRDRDHKITEADFDWSKHSLTPSPAMMLFFMGDRDANGKLTKDEFTQLFDTFSGGKGDYLAIDELRDQFQQPPSNSEEPHPDQPSRSTLIMGLKNQEVGSLQPGPNVDEVAPDFTLSTPDGQPVTLSKEVGDKPIVLIFGNFTCGPFRSQAGNIEKLYQRYQDRAKFYLVYVREAHPSDGWWMISNQRAGIALPQPRSNAERKTVAATCQKHLDLAVPFLVDDLDDQVGSTYSGMPNRLYLIDQQGRIAFKNGRGPFGFHPRQLEQQLVLLLNAEPTSN